MNQQKIVNLMLQLETGTLGVSEVLHQLLEVISAQEADITALNGHVHTLQRLVEPDARRFEARAAALIGTPDSQESD